jgi:hypothetical protein
MVGGRVASGCFPNGREERRFHYLSRGASDRSLFRAGASARHSGWTRVRARA